MTFQSGVTTPGSGPHKVLTWTVAFVLVTAVSFFVGLLAVEVWRSVLFARRVTSMVRRASTTSGPRRASIHGGPHSGAGWIVSNPLKDGSGSPAALVAPAAAGASGAPTQPGSGPRPTGSTNTSGTGSATGVPGRPSGPGSGSSSSTARRGSAIRLVDSQLEELESAAETTGSSPSESLKLELPEASGTSPGPTDPPGPGPNPPGCTTSGTEPALQGRGGQSGQLEAQVTLPVAHPSRPASRASAGSTGTGVVPGKVRPPPPPPSPTTSNSGPTSGSGPTFSLALRQLGTPGRGTTTRRPPSPPPSPASAGTGHASVSSSPPTQAGSRGPVGVGARAGGSGGPAGSGVPRPAPAQPKDGSVKGGSQLEAGGQPGSGSSAQGLRGLLVPSRQGRISTMMNPQAAPKATGGSTSAP
jgi:hypothetical protein